MNNDVHIRLARSFDQRELEALQLRASLSNPGDRDALLADPDAAAIPMSQIESGQVFVAEVGGSIQGFAAIVPRADDDMELDALFVEPGLWRRGLGRKLVEHCVQVARRRGAAAIHVIGNPHAEGFYAACGFKIVGIQKTRFGHGLLMRRGL